MPCNVLHVSCDLLQQHRADHNHVLEHSLHQLLREIHHHNSYQPLPHPATAVLGVSKRRRLAGPLGYTREKLHEPSRLSSYFILALLDITGIGRQVVGSSPGWAPLCNGLGQATYICVPLSASSIIWYQPTGMISLTQKVTTGLVESNGSLTPGL